MIYMPPLLGKYFCGNFDFSETSERPYISLTLVPTNENKEKIKKNMKNC